MSSASSALSNDSALSSLLSSLSSSPSPSYTSVLSLLHYLHDHSLHRPSLIVEYGCYLLRQFPSRLQDYKRDLYEKVFISALDLHDDNTACWCLSNLSDRFGFSSLRIQRLTGLQFEGEGKYEAASTVYGEILAKDEANLFALKRQIALLKERGKWEESIRLLNRYVKIFSSDESGWLELIELYVAQQQFELAGFCAEELILLVPEHWYYHLLLADCLYSAGKFDTARQYYAQSLQLKPNNNLRANYGLILAIRNGATGGKSSSSASASGSGSGSGTSSATKLYSWSVDKLVNHYQKYAPEMLSMVKEAMEIGEPVGVNTGALATTG